MTAPIVHPAWCSPAGCTITGEPGQGAHVSRVRIVPAGELMLSLRLYRGAALAGYPDSEVVLVMLRVDGLPADDGETALEWPLRLRPARELAGVLRSMVAAATR